MGSSILQAILGGVAGGAEGISQVREQRRLAEERKAEAERRARAERLQYVSAGFVPEASVGAMDMPGATPRKSFMSAVLSDGERMVMERDPSQTQHFEAMRAYGFERDKKRAEEARQAEQMNAFIESLPPEERSRVGTALRAAQAGVPANVAQQLVPRETQLPWQKEGFASMQEYLDFKGKESAATRAPRVGREALSDREQAIRDINEETMRFQRTAKPSLPGLPGALPTEQEVYQYRDRLLRMRGLAPMASAQTPRTEAQAPAAPAASAATQGASLEQEFPNAADRIREARRDGYSDEEIRAYLSRGR